MHGLLGGSWVVLSGVISRVTVITKRFFMTYCQVIVFQPDLDRRSYSVMINTKHAYKLTHPQTRATSKTHKNATVLRESARHAAYKVRLSKKKQRFIDSLNPKP